MLILKVYSILFIALLLGISLIAPYNDDDGKSFDSGAILFTVMLLPILIYIILGGS